MSRDFPNRHDCILCGREVEQDDDTRGWYFADDFVYTRPGRPYEFTDAFETFAGWCCGSQCWNDHALDLVDLVDVTEEPDPAHHGLFLVKGGAA
jgi:hypothetical protein